MNNKEQAKYELRHIFKCFCAWYEKQVDVVCFLAFGGVQQFEKKKTEFKPVKRVR